jgi:deoxyribose-phosphate aldolase
MAYTPELERKGQLSLADLAGMIDHTVLKPEATPSAIDKLCDEAVRYGFKAVCVNPMWIPRCAKNLAGSAVSVCSVIGFPLGAHRTDTKVDEARRAMDDGAVEIDMVVRLGDLVSGNTSAVRDDIAAVAEAVHAHAGSILKVILETAALSREQIIAGCRASVEAKADFVKTSTGFHPDGGATTESVRLLAEYGAPLKVKAAGGIRNLPTLKAMVAAGADRIGCSAAPKILELAKRLDM